MQNQPFDSRKLIEQCLDGISLESRVPVAMWRHFPVDDQTPGGLTAAISAFQRQYAFDIIKITPASSFCIRDWGVRDAWSGNPEGTRDYSGSVIQDPEDWRKLKELDPTQGFLGKQIVCIKALVKEFSRSTPIIQTVFSPLAQAKNLVGKDRLVVHIRENPDAVLAGLEIIAKSTQGFISETIKTGVDGLFYAVQHAQHGILSDLEFEIFGKAFDLKVLEGSDKLWLNMVHIHGNDIMFNQVKDYPAAILNWHDRQTYPNLSEAQKIFPGVVCGGLRQWETMVLGNSEQVSAEAKQAIQATGGKKFILGTGCVLPVTIPHGNIIAALKAAGRKDIL
jgi:uroporphyrinogen decarboxylase